MELQLTTLPGCALAIGAYPRFTYNPQGGRGIGWLGEDDGRGRPLEFSPAELRIPPLSWRSTRVLGVPLPPGLTIAVEPRQLSGHLQPGSGELRLRFRARFHCSALGFYRPAALAIDAELSTGPVTSRRHSCRGAALDSDGRGVLVGVAQVPPSGDAWLDRFLGLPDEALALLRCRLIPLESQLRRG
ncbi:MAG: hypothetical protein EA413_00140 [Cyanobium sp. PLM2.Bin73]|nr:MAG: hypothetical protein EA413_00140 [Cyanobium sp. PLM2.Bin73]